MSKLVVRPELSLAFSLYSAPGTYALLLGSGLSRAAGVPTGWEVTLDLVRKLAAAEGEPTSEPEVWYRERFDGEPSYSEVVERLAPTRDERRALLQDYFEPNELEREEGKKLPTTAHRAIARLCSTRHIRVVLTTNFDRLLERALEAEGVSPVVVDTPDAADGAPPLQHSGCTVVKVNGDYLDTRIKNAPEELADYEPRMRRLLERVFTEYGLVVCGWSGTYDFALVDALKRAGGSPVHDLLGLPGRAFGGRAVAYNLSEWYVYRGSRRGRVLRGSHREGRGAGDFWRGTIHSRRRSRWQRQNVTWTIRSAACVCGSLLDL